MTFTSYILPEILDGLDHCRLADVLVKAVVEIGELQLPEVLCVLKCKMVLFQVINK